MDNENRTMASEIIASQEEKLRIIISELDSTIDDLLWKGKFVLTELMDLTEKGSDNEKEACEFAYNQERMDMLAHIAFDYVHQAQCVLNEIVVRESKMKQNADETRTDITWGERDSDSKMWQATANPDWSDMKGNEPKRIYENRLDTDYFTKCVENAVDYILNECDFSEDRLKKELERIKNQVYGLRDVFWLFTFNNIMKIAEPVKQALEE